jgi:hypothetical protein
MARCRSAPQHIIHRLFNLIYVHVPNIQVRERLTFTSKGCALARIWALQARGLHHPGSLEGACAWLAVLVQAVGEGGFPICQYSYTVLSTTNTVADLLSDFPVRINYCGHVVGRACLGKWMATPPLHEIKLYRVYQKHTDFALIK